MSGVEEGLDVQIEDGLVSITMNKVDISSNFNIIPVFSDSRCSPIFNPSSLQIQIDLTHVCGNEEETIEVNDATPLSYFRNVDVGNFIQVLRA